MCDPALCLNPVISGVHPVDRAQRVIADAGQPVLQVEHVTLAKATGRILGPAALPGPPGAAPEGETAGVPHGTLLGANHIPMLASHGGPVLSVYRRLRVGVLTAGGNWVTPGMHRGQGQSFNLAGPVLVSLLDKLGAQAISAPHVADQEQSFGPMLDMLLAECNVVLIAACMRAGQHDSIRRALLGRGAELRLHRIRMRPTGTLAIASIGSKLVVCLPPGLAPTFLSFVLFVSPLIRRLQGRRDVFPPVRSVAVAGMPRATSHADTFLWAHEADRDGGAATVLGHARGADAVAAIGRATGIVRAGLRTSPAVGARFYSFAKWLV